MAILIAILSLGASLVPGAGRPGRGSRAVLTSRPARPAPAAAVSPPGPAPRAAARAPSRTAVAAQANASARLIVVPWATTWRASPSTSDRIRQAAADGSWQRKRAVPMPRRIVSSRSACQRRLSRREVAWMAGRRAASAQASSQSWNAGSASAGA